MNDRIVVVNNTDDTLHMDVEVQQVHSIIGSAPPKVIRATAKVGERVNLKRIDGSIYIIETKKRVDAALTFRINNRRMLTVWLGCGPVCVSELNIKVTEADDCWFELEGERGLKARVSVYLEED